MSFAHLHVHTEYSLLDGACRIRDLPSRIKAMGQNAVAITDHGVMYGVIDFYRACLEQDVKPIIGCEVYVAPRTRFDRVRELDGESRHLVLLCENNVGYKNLAYMVSMAFTEGFYTHPRIDLDLLKDHHEGLIALSACLAGEIPKRLSRDDYAGAKEYAKTMADIMGDDHFYLELQDHGIPEQRKVNNGILRLHDELGLPLVVTNDAHYLSKEDAYSHDVLLCIQTGKTVDDTNRMRYEPQNFYLRSTEEMSSLFPEYPEAVENTQKIADRCNVSFTFGKYHLPEYKLPEGYSSLGYLKELCYQGFDELYGSEHPEYRKQLDYEINMIDKMGFTDYFLIVQDFVNYAKSVKIPVGPGRGSAAGSMVSYCLHITEIDPVKYALYFERFLNPERVSMPDIDMDFGDTRRQEVVDYVRRKYGDDRVAQIVTFGTMAAKGAIRDVGRALNMPYADVDAVAKLVPNAPKITLTDALQQSPQLKEAYDNDTNIRHLIDTALLLEGMPRNASTHAAGVVITKLPVYEYVPLAKNDDLTVCQYTMVTLEQLGLLKMDFLGLRNLTILDDALEMVRKTQPDFQLKDIPDDDPETYEMITQGRTSGVFQMESTGMTSVCIGLKPQSIEDLTAIIALYRPGPMDSIPRFIACKQNPALIQYKHPSLKPILDVTYGCIVYQEQVIEIFRRLGGYSLGQADMVRRAISKKKVKEIEKEKKAFIYGDADRGIQGCIANGIQESTAEAIYNEIYDFANYAFNKAHAVSYAVVAYQTAYFKCHYTKEYMAALLSSVLDRSDKIGIYISECKDNHIPLLPPDINHSYADFTVEGNGIRFGLVAIKNIGRGFIEDMVKERTSHGMFKDLSDLCERCFDTDMNKRALENLIRSGALDCFGKHRSQLLAVSNSVLDNIADVHRKNLEGQTDLFSMQTEEVHLTETVYPNIPEFSQKDRMTMEKETTGLYLSGHPLDEYRAWITAKKIPSVYSILEDFAQESGPRLFRDGQTISICGVITSHKQKITKNNSLMAYVTVEDETASMELLCFSKVLETCGPNLREGEVVCVSGKISVRDEKAPQILCDSAYPMEVSTQNLHLPAAIEKMPAQKERQFQPCLFLRIPSTDCEQWKHCQLTLSMFEGSVPVKVRVADTNKVLLGHCQPDDLLLKELVDTLGQENVVFKH